MKNISQEHKERLEIIAKLLSWDHGKHITVKQVLVAYEVHLWGGAPFGECIEMAYIAEEILKQQKIK